MSDNVWMWQVPHGHNKGGWTLRDVTPPLTVSGWAYNNFILVIEENEEEEE